jgi:hypothetical protein
VDRNGVVQGGQLRTFLTTLTARQAATAGAVAAGLVTLAVGLANVPLDSVTHHAGTGGVWADALSTAAAVVPTVAVGTLLAARRPRNPIGWMILAIIIVGFSPTADYEVLDYRMHHGTLPLGGVAVILQQSWPLFLMLVTILLWIFPDGTLPAGRRRRPAVVLVSAGLVLSLAACSPGLAAVAGHDVRVGPDGQLLTPASVVDTALELAAILASGAAILVWLIRQIPTYRHAAGVRRQQLKWLYTGGAVLAAVVLVLIFAVPLAMGEAPGWSTQPVVNVLGSLGFGVLPVCLGVAVLRYRLYELDRIISRVVSYAVVTGLLVGVYAGLVLLATRVLPFRSAVGVAASTLITAALFNPVRRRVQQVVDRRFNRSRYNAQALVSSFTTRLQQTVDLDVVRSDLAEVASAAFQPAHVSIWLARAEQ